MIKIEYKAEFGYQASNVFQTLHVCFKNGHLRNERGKICITLKNLASTEQAHESGK